MNVPDSVKEQYKSNSIHKNLVLRFPEIDLQISHKDIHHDSVRLKESLLDRESIEFVGCIASIYCVDIENLSADVKGKKLEAAIYTDSETDPVPLFHGIVDSAVNHANTKTKEIIAYDELYYKGNIDVAGWYKSLEFPIMLKELRNSLFIYIGIEQVETDLANDSIEIKKRYNPSSLQALAVIKSICQINGVFGIINRQNKFEYRIPKNILRNDDEYSPVVLYPQFYPAKEAGCLEEVHAEEIAFYKSVDCEEYIVKPVDKITIRQNENDEGITYGEGENNYIIQGNMFTYKLEKDILLQAAEKIYENIKGFYYRPFEAECNGLPWMECGLDAVSYVMLDWKKSTSEKDVYKQESFYMLSRELTGVQALKDSYSAQGEEYQTEFITDLQTQIDTIKNSTRQEIEDYTYPREEIDSMIAGSGSGWNVLSVGELPENPEADTIYLIQGEVTVE